jgi:uncharacterized protein (TIGR02147 family)
MKPAFREILAEEFERRRTRNPTYSLRAYARDLQVPAPKLSQYLSGSCGISSKRALAVGKILKLSELELELFVASAEAHHARNQAARTFAQQKVHRLLASSFTAVNMEKFALIRDWHHLAILELFHVREFRSDAAWIAKQLKLSKSTVSEALDRLELLGFIDRTNVPWKETAGDFSTPADFSSRAIREYHRQILRKADESLEQTIPEDREFGVLTCNMDHDLLPQLKEMIRKFRKEVSALTKKSPKKDSVYSLAIQFFPIYQENQ